MTRADMMGQCIYITAYANGLIFAAQRLQHGGFTWVSVSEATVFSSPDSAEAKACVKNFQRSNSRVTNQLRGFVDAGIPARMTEFRIAP